MIRRESSWIYCCVQVAILSANVPIVSCFGWRVRLDLDSETHHHPLSSFHWFISSKKRVIMKLSHKDFPPSPTRRSLSSSLVFPLHILHLSPSLSVFFSLRPPCSLQKTAVPLGFSGFVLSSCSGKASLFLMSSASVALSPRLSTTDLLAFASLCFLSSFLSFYLLRTHTFPPPIKLLCLSD